MASVNKVILLGNLGADPDVRYTAEGNRAIAQLSIATTRRYRNQQSQELVSETEWHRVVLFGRTAEVAKDYLRKGHPVYIEGRLRTRKWQDQNGQDRYTTEIVGETMQLLSGRDRQDTGVSSSYVSRPADSYATRQSDNSFESGPRPHPQTRNAVPAPATTSSIDNLDEDVPF